MRVLERCTVVLDGVLTEEAAERVAEALRWLRPGGALRIDLTKADDLQAVGLAQLVRLLQAHHEPVSVRILGLRQRDRRMLNYLGLDLDASGGATSAPESSTASC